MLTRKRMKRCLQSLTLLVASFGQPEAYHYRLLFVERPLEEVVASQVTLLALRGECI
jgi:hypothetical protein